jgi:hypothetical protein
VRALLIAVPTPTSKRDLIESKATEDLAVEQLVAGSCIKDLAVSVPHWLPGAV